MNDFALYKILGKTLSSYIIKGSKAGETVIIKCTDETEIKLLCVDNELIIEVTEDD
jgi:hypothetical protein